MTLISLRKIKAFSVVLALLLVVFIPRVLLAQSNTVSLSVTPTLFEMSAAPLQVWQSSVKVINNNPYNLTVYLNAVNFAPQGESGQGKFLPVFETMSEGTTLAEWLEITNEPVVLEPGESKSVPFTVRVPEDASPGGHFAAIMVGTRPPDNGEDFQIKTSQIVTSLFFLRVAGDVVEDGMIREFRSSKNFYTTPQANFEVRFENKGNVHIQPQGEIKIKNMWGKERGVIPINHKTHFGNVLPASIRKFEFSWKGELSPSDIGRYSAELALAYGTDQRKFVTSKTYFWVVPVKPVLLTLGTLGAILFFIFWSVRTYIRHMLALQGYQPVRRRDGSFVREGDVLIKKANRIDAPVRAGWFDLRNRLEQAKALVDIAKVLLGFVTQYRLFFATVLGAVGVVGLIIYFVVSVTEDSRDYEVTIDNLDTSVKISSEQILYEQQQSEQEVAVTNEGVIKVPEVQPFELYIVNSSDTPGQAAELQSRLEATYEIAGLESDFNESKARSVIVYHKDLQAEALALREQLGDFILSALPPESEEKVITIYIGNDYSTQ